MPFFLEGVWGNLLSLGTKERGSPTKDVPTKKLPNFTAGLDGGDELDIGGLVGDDTDL